MLSDRDMDELLGTLNSPEASDAPLQKEAERVNTVRGVGIFIYPDEGGHKIPHFHAYVNDERSAVIVIDTLEIMPKTKSTLTKAELRAVKKWAAGPDPDPNADPLLPLPTPRKQLLLESWNQARAGTTITHIAGSLGPLTPPIEPPEVVARRLAPKVFSMSDDAWRPFSNWFKQELSRQLLFAGVESSTVNGLVNQVLKNLDDAAWKAVEKPLKSE